MWSLDSITAAVSRHDEKSLILYSQKIMRNITNRLYEESEKENRKAFDKLMQPAGGDVGIIGENPIVDENYRASRALPHSLKINDITNDDNPNIL